MRPVVPRLDLDRTHPRPGRRAQTTRARLKPRPPRQPRAKTQRPLTHEEAVRKRLQELKAEQNALYKNPAMKQTISRESLELRGVLARWDGGSKRARTQILRQFVVKFDGATGPQLDEAFGYGASLFLARLSAWLRLTYLFGEHIALKLKSISIFIAATSGQRFLAEFLEVGGILTVVSILRLERAREVDLKQALRLLELVGSAGRAYKEMVCDGEGDGQGIHAIAECLMRAKETTTKAMARDLLYYFGTGNPRCLPDVRAALLMCLSSGQAEAQQMASYVLRLLMPVSGATLSHIAPVVVMCRSLDLQVQYETTELVKVLRRDGAVLPDLLVALIGLLKTPRDVAFVLDATPDDNSAMADTTLARKPFLSRSRSQRIVPAAFPQQAMAAGLLGTLCEEDSVREQAIDLGVCQRLLGALGNTAFFDSQRAAVQTLRVLWSAGDVAAATRRAIGTLFDELREGSEEHVEVLLRGLSPRHVHILTAASDLSQERFFSPGEESAEYVAYEDFRNFVAS